MNKTGQAEEMGWGIAFIVIFAFTFLFGISFLRLSEADFNIETLEDSIVATRVLNCFSDDDFVFDETKMTMVEFRRCFSTAKYILKIELDKKNGENKIFEPYGEVGGITRKIERYVKLQNSEEGILKIIYRKSKNET